MVELDLSTTRRIHVVGVGGPGMSALAIVLAQMGHRVSGSDVRETAVLANVRAAGVSVAIGHDPAVVTGCDAVTYSTAVPLDNVE
ncbi:MAG: UDP-N-acetylmuramate--L-alanine ligase, partial [Actinomycetota bacterium]